MDVYRTSGTRFDIQVGDLVRHEEGLAHMTVIQVQGEQVEVWVDFYSTRLPAEKLIVLSRPDPKTEQT